MKKLFIYIVFILLFFNISINAKDKFLSLKNSKVNVRYGPSLVSPVKYIYKKIDFPLKIIDKQENFRRIIDIKKNTGWIHRSQLKKSKSFITLKDKILFKKPSIFSKPILKLEKGRLLLVKKCNEKWCKVKTLNYTGWVNTDNVWGNY